MYGGAGIKWQEYEDGYLYEVYAPIGADPSIIPRAKTVKIILEGRWVAAFEEADINYLTVWIPRMKHEDLFPGGPPEFRYYDENAKKSAFSEYRDWVDPNETMPGPANRTGEIKLVELAKLVEEEGSS